MFVLQASHEERLKQKLLEEQFALLQGTVSEAESIIQDAVAKLDDPLHIRCTSSPGACLRRHSGTTPWPSVNHGSHLGSNPAAWWLQF